MLNLGMLYFKSDRGLTVPDVLNPSIVAENLTSLRSKQETLHVFNATRTIYHFFFSSPEQQRKFADPESGQKRSGQMRRGGVSLMPASSTVRFARGGGLQSNYLGSTRLLRHIFKPGSRRSEEQGRPGASAFGQQGRDAGTVFRRSNGVVDGHGCFKRGGPARSRHHRGDDLHP